jgi:hypothetical protein
MLAFLGLVTLQNTRPAAPTLREPEIGGNPSDVDVEMQLLGELADGDSLPDNHLPSVTLPDNHIAEDSLSNIALSDVPLPEVPHPEPGPDGSVGKECMSPRSAFGLAWGS